jgi:hypothetical protein
MACALRRHPRVGDRRRFHLSSRWSSASRANRLLAYPEAIASVVAHPSCDLERCRLAGRLPASPPKRSSTRSTARRRCSEDDVRSLVARAASTGIFTLRSIGCFAHHACGHLTVRDLMVRATASSGSTRASRSTRFVRRCGPTPRSYFPICRGGLDRVVGVAHQDLIAAGFSREGFQSDGGCAAATFRNDAALKLLDLFMAPSRLRRR